MSSSVIVRCCIEVPPAYEAKARYALRMLLVPLGIDPLWVDRDALTERGVYYGREPVQTFSEQVVLPYDAEAASYFSQPEMLPKLRGWYETEGLRTPVFFGDAQHPDVVAHAFFWLSGWQELVTRTRDVHGRFPYHASLQAKWELAGMPAVDIYRLNLADRLRAAGLPLTPRHWGSNSWALCATHDVDYVRKWRPGMIYRESVQYLLLNRREANASARLRRFAAFARDWASPGDVYRQAIHRMRQAVISTGGTATYFFKASAHGPRDVDYALNGSYVRKLIQGLETDGFEVGLHPSYHTPSHPERLVYERSHLSSHMRAAPVSVRQHYLRVEPGLTPRWQAAAGFRIDSSLGFAEHEGFRHGTCLPFQLYDSVRDVPLPIWEFPLLVMESALFNRRMLSGEEAWEATERLLHTIRSMGGVATVLWHNVLWDELDYPGWGAHFERTMQYGRSNGALIDSLASSLRSWYPEAF